MGAIRTVSLIAVLCVFMPIGVGAGQKAESLSRSAEYLEPAPTKHWRWLERDWGTALVLRPYRSYGSFFVDLSTAWDLAIWEGDEVKLYRDLIRSSVKPDYFLIEVTGYPLAAFSAWLEEEKNSSYRYFDIGEEFNLIRSLGAGYQEPWSTSVFLGHLATFWTMDAQDEMVVAASGAAGIVATAGLHQLFDNSIVEAGWFRVEWKVKGEGIEGPKKRFWDLKAGYRCYGITEISNTMSLSLKRQRTDKDSRSAGLLNNSMAAIELQIPASEASGGFSRIMFEYARFVPIRKVLAGLKVGFLYENRKPYQAETRSFGVDRKKSWELIVQPVVVF